MRKTIFSLVLMLIGISVGASAQELKPLRINLAAVGNGELGAGLGAEYVFPLKKMSLGAELAVTFPLNIGAFVRLYPDSSLGEGLNYGIEYQYHFEIQQPGTQGKSAWHDLGAGLGWQWIVGDWMDIGLGMSCDYQMFQGPSYSSNQLVAALNAHVGILLK
jgi:hypothetical protein